MTDLIYNKDEIAQYANGFILLTAMISNSYIYLNNSK